MQSEALEVEVSFHSQRRNTESQTLRTNEPVCLHLYHIRVNAWSGEKRVPDMLIVLWYKCTLKVVVIVIVDRFAIFL